MTKVIILCLLSLLSVSIYGQKQHGSVSKNSCTGAINVFDNGQFQLRFSGENGGNITEAYPSLSTITSTNQIWCSYIASQAGVLKFTASVDSDFLQMVIFSQERDDVCGEIRSGLAEIKRLQTSQKYKIVGLDELVSDGVMYSLKLREGEKIQILFVTKEAQKSVLNLNWNFKADVILANQSTKVIDKRYDDFAATFTIKVKDTDTQKPLVGNIEIQDSKQVDGVYRASELYFNLERNCEISLLCKLDGYFFDERILKVSPYEDQEVVIYLNKVASGMSIKIEDIQFKPGTSEILPSSEPKLNRLKDFLALNANLEVEIQGHVFELGEENSLMGQKISEARAKRVMKHLIDHGIDKSRLTAVGYGNTRPVFEEPKLFAEEQANRRVEILIK